MKNIFLFSLIMLWAVAVAAQPNTMSGFVAGAVTQDNTYSVLGQPFVGQSSGYGFQVSEGIAQSQLVRESYQALVNEGDGYSQHGYDYPGSTSAGTYHNQLYVVHGAQYNYDLLKTLKLIVLGPFSCGDSVYDGDLSAYSTVWVAGYCWTQQNLRAEHYADGSTPVSQALAYQSLGHPDANANVSTFGRLYTWHSAVNLPEGSANSPATDANGYVQGVCPNGWHIPTVVEISALQVLTADNLRSADTWIQPNANANESLFSALGSGIYSADRNRFEGMLTQTDFWSVQGNLSNSLGTALELAYFCDDAMVVQRNTADALSVRCVRNYEE